MNDNTFRPRRTLKSDVQTMDTLRDELIRLHTIHKTWRRVSIHFDCKIPAGTLSSIAKGREPKKVEYRHILGLPALVDVPACSDCGRGHAVGWCVEKYGEPAKPPSSKPKKPRRPPWYSLPDNMPDGERLARVMKGWVPE